MLSFANSFLEKKRLFSFFLFFFFFCLSILRTPKIWITFSSFKPHLSLASILTTQIVIDALNESKSLKEGSP